MFDMMTQSSAAAPDQTLQRTSSELQAAKLQRNMELFKDVCFLSNL